MKEVGITLLIGTDNAMLQPPRLIDEIQHIHHIAPNIFTIEQLLEMITYIPRKVLNLKDDMQDATFPPSTYCVLDERTLQPLVHTILTRERWYESRRSDVKRISCWIYVPPKVGAGGDSHRPNGVQLFAKSVENLGKKSEKWCSKYGPWKNLSGKEGHWFKIFLVIDNKERYGGYKEECFDPRNIAIIGVKFGVGDYSKRDYEGPAYIDALNW